MAEQLVNKFMEQLRAKAFNWSDEPRPDLGLKLVEFDGGFIRNLVVADRFDEFWAQIDEQLPADAQLLDFPQGEILLQAVGTSVYRDAYMAVFASDEWEPIKEGAEIPVLRIKVKAVFTLEAAGAK